jgi:hypothetical protein
MITSKDMDSGRVVYPKPRLIDKRPKMGRISGFDSEAYRNGRPFMFCTSGGWIGEERTTPEILMPRDLPHVFFTPRYQNVNFMTYNLKYDSGAALWFLDGERLEELRFKGYTWTDDKIRVTYIPHKMLEFKKGDISTRFWDIAQFYKMSLDMAAKTYLKEKKIDIRTKTFSEEYVIRCFHSIARYCIHDAILAEKLGIYLIDVLERFDITASTIYSCASIAFKYFCRKTKFNTVYQYWKSDTDVLRYALDAYQGGKFEITSRGRFTGYEYDITSAYPYEIRNLVDISRARVVYSRDFLPGAVYGFLRCRIHNPRGVHLPCGPMLGQSGKNVLRVYPAGTYYMTVTQEEFIYISTLSDVEIEIFSAVFLFVKRKKYPYRGVIDDLFCLKSRYKGKDRMLYSVTKILMNSTYGKMCQCTEKHTGKVHLGSGFNPVHASVITANTRIKVTDIQNRMGDKCLALHTDSVMVTEPISENLITNSLGGFEYVTKGSGILIACGLYQIADTCAWKGVSPARGETWEKILTRFKNRYRIPYSHLHVESWREAMAKNHPVTAINVFEKAKKQIDLNCDLKRRWPSRVRARDLLSTRQDSVPRVWVENSPPENWEV